VQRKIGRRALGVKADAIGLFLDGRAAILRRCNRPTGIKVATYDDNDSSEHLQTALQAARAAAEISRSYYSGNFTVTTKDDLTPVTQADVECEQKIREIILERFPEHGFFGEETGRTQADAEYLWLVDPIDGTKGFVRRYPFFSTQIALLHKGQIVVGVSSGTMLQELAWAERGRGAWLNGQRLAVSEISDPERAAVSTGNLKSLARSGGWNKLGDIVARADRIRGYGDFYHYHLLASGKIEAVIESDVNILDIAALSLIVVEAGGLFTDLNGKAIGLETRSVLATNAALHDYYLDGLRDWVI
jgi:histidinol-phosphatase